MTRKYSKYVVALVFSSLLFFIGKNFTEITLINNSIKDKLVASFILIWAMYILQWYLGDEDMDIHTFILPLLVVCMCGFVGIVLSSIGVFFYTAAVACLLISLISLK